MTITNKEKLNWLRLARSENVGPLTFFRLIERFGGATEALEQVSELRSNISLCSEQEAEKELEKIEKFGAQLILFCEEKYPRSLREIASPPPVLTAKGQIEFLQRDSVAIVGARNASLNGKSFAQSVAVDIGNSHMLITSGMARGIDTAAHEGALASGTIGVIGGGINTVYPNENADLYEQVLEYGLLISEVPFNTPPRSENFVQRNRLISGLALAVIVIEAGLKSGSLITAHCAIDQGKEVYAVPGSPFDPRSKGTNRLIKEGANIFENVEDFLSSLPDLQRSYLLLKTNVEEKPKIITTAFDQDIRKIREEILQRLNFQPILVDEIINELQLPTKLVNATLVEMEMENLIQVESGRLFKALQH
ncbi:MAG: DNA-protecting protein DprA [Alphaproteobacteria bacterium]|nr:DNA-protecting protein DprA [Alphaproteobacteria bacterium]